MSRQFTPIRQTPCPHCRVVMTETSQANGNDKPSPGDFSVCFSCGGLTRFTASLGLEKLNLDDVPLTELDAEARVLLGRLSEHFAKAGPSS